MSAFYDEVLRCLNVFPLNQHFDRSWTAHVAVKSALYEAESQMQAAAALHLDDDVHIEITRLKVCSAALCSNAIFTLQGRSSASSCDNLCIEQPKRARGTGREC